jgi:transcriptional regulator with XRE-family HTH domain
MTCGPGPSTRSSYVRAAADRLDVPIDVVCAELIGKSQSAISQIETGEIALSLDVLRAIVTELGGTLEVAAVFDDRRVFLDA